MRKNMNAVAIWFAVAALPGVSLAVVACGAPPDGRGEGAEAAGTDEGAAVAEGKAKTEFYGGEGSCVLAGCAGPSDPSPSPTIPAPSAPIFQEPGNPILLGPIFNPTPITIVGTQVGH